MHSRVSADPDFGCDCRHGAGNFNRSLGRLRAGAGNCLLDELSSFRPIAPMLYCGPLARFQSFVVCEEVLDLSHRDFGKIGVVGNFILAHCQFAAGHRDDFLITASLVLHNEHTNGTAIDDGSRYKGARVADENVDGIAVSRQCVRHEAVVSWVSHGRVEEPIHDKRARGLVQLILDRLPSDGNLDDHIDVEGRIVPDGDGIGAQGSPPIVR